MFDSTWIYLSLELGFSGSIASTSANYIFPAAFYYKLCNHSPYSLEYDSTINGMNNSNPPPSSLVGWAPLLKRKVFPAMLFVFGSIVGITSTAVLSYKVATGDE